MELADALEPLSRTEATQNQPMRSNQGARPKKRSPEHPDEREQDQPEEAAEQEPHQVDSLA